MKLKTSFDKTPGKILIWYEENQPPDFEGTVFLWNIFQKENDFNMVSIPYELEKNSEEYRKKYLDLNILLSNLKIDNKALSSFFKIEDNFSLWWMNLSIEKNYGKSSQLITAIKILVLENILTKIQGFDIYYSISTPRSLIRYLKKITKCVKRLNHTAVPSHRKKIFNRDQIPNFILGCFTFLKFINFCGGLKFRKKAHILNSSDLHFFSYFFHLSSKKDIVYESAYWGSLFGKMKTWDMSANIVHLYVPSKEFPKISCAFKSIQKLNFGTDQNFKHNLIEHVTPKIAYEVFFKFLVFSLTYLFKIKFRYKEILKDIKYRPILFLWKEITDSLYGSIAIQNLFYYYFISDYIRSVVGKSKLIYLMENQGWEKALVYLWKNKVGGKVIGVPHATVRFWDLRYSYSKDQNGFLQDECCPDMIAVNGKLANDQLLNFGYEKNKLVQVEALRFESLSKIQLVASSSKNNLLVFTDYLESVSKFQLEILNGSATFLKSYKIIIKPHPACPISVKEYPDLDCIIRDERSDVLFREASVVFTSNITSASVEAFYLGLPVVSSRDPKEINLSPLFGIKGFNFVSSSKEFELFLSQCDANAPNYIRNEVFNQNELLNYWKNILTGNTIDHRN